MTLGPVALPEGRFEMRTPRLSDGPAWSRARLANREWLERAFPAWGDDWAAEQSETAWAERWWPLRRAALLGRAMPFVMTLDGRLIGEIGIDAIDALSNGGEASVWMVRDHGSAAVMNAASLLLIQHSFTTARPIDRLVSPVATAARAGRSPGLSAVGLRIEGTVARRVGDKGMVDHDIWVIQNTAANRERVASFVATMPAAAGGPAAQVDRTAMARPSLRAAVRGGRSGMRRLTATPAPDRRSASGDVVLHALGPRPTGVAAWRADRADRSRAPHGMAVERIEHHGARVGTIWSHADPGTATHEFIATVDPGVDPAVLRSALQTALQDVDESYRAAVRVQHTSTGGTQPDDAMLKDLGLTLVATFEGDPDGRHAWAGEQRWELIT